MFPARFLMAGYNNNLPTLARYPLEKNYANLISNYATFAGSRFDLFAPRFFVAFQRLFQLFHWIIRLAQLTILWWQPTILFTRPEQKHGAHGMKYITILPKWVWYIMYDARFHFVLQLVSTIVQWCCLVAKCREFNWQQIRNSNTWAQSQMQYKLHTLFACSLFVFDRLFVGSIIAIHVYVLWQFNLFRQTEYFFWNTSAPE